MTLLLALLACKPTPTPETADTDDTDVDTDDTDDTDVDTDDTDDLREIPPVTAPPTTVLGHAEQCQQALGPIPGFDCIEDAAPMPITVDGVPVTGNVDTCDKPSLLEGSCNAWTRAGRKTGTWMNGDPRPEVTFIFTCRSEDDAAPTNEGGMYHDVAMIGHNEETGATCFFQSFPDSRIRYFPSPLTAGASPDYGTIDAAEIWYRPTWTADIDCHHCHGGDPWIHSPWIDQLPNPDDPSEPLVPWTGGNDTPYHVVGGPFASWELRHVAPADNACVSCHRVRPGSACVDFNMYSFGLETDMPLTASASSENWMPPDPNADLLTWQADFYELLACCGDPSLTGCNLQDVPEGQRYVDPTPPPVDTADTGITPDTALTCALPDADVGSALGTVYTGNTCGAAHDYVRSCGEYGSNGEDYALTWTAPSAGSWRFDTEGSAFDTTISLRTPCSEGNDELACNDDTVGLTSQVSYTLGAGETVVVVIDTYEGPECGAFSLQVSAD